MAVDLENAAFWINYSHIQRMYAVFSTRSNESCSGRHAFACAEIGRGSGSAREDSMQDTSLLGHGQSAVDWWHCS